MNNITVGESRLKGVALCHAVDPATLKYGEIVRPDSIPINSTLNKVLSTPLPPVEDCVFINDKGELEWKRS